MATGRIAQKQAEIALEDFQFLMTTELLDATPEACKRNLILAMQRLEVPAGTRFITQGEPGECFYLVQSGSCVVSLDKNGQSYQVARLESGDVVGEISVLTGENRSAHVDAETNMVLWRMGLDAFNEICSQCPDIQEFLTDLATERLCSQKITAERSIGRYVVNEILAEGGWSIVYKGVHGYLNLPVAVKMLKHNMARDPDFLGQFQNEAKTIARLNHENIVKVYDIEHVFRTVFIVMEYLEGVALRNILKKRLRLPHQRMLDILIQVCIGLDYAHQQGIVHRDVKPGNIFIEKNDRVKIVDFGVAAPIGVCSPDLPGTAYYMAPEQIEGDPVDARTDIYSLGITAYEMATGRRPYPDDVCEVLKAHITEQTPDPRVLNPDLPLEFAAFIAKATRKDPAERYQNLSQVLAELRSMATSPGERTHAQPKGKRRMMSLFMFYEDGSRPELNRLMETLGEELRRIGAELRVADFENI